MGVATSIGQKNPLPCSICQC